MAKLSNDEVAALLRMVKRLEEDAGMGIRISNLRMKTGHPCVRAKCSGCGAECCILIGEPCSACGRRLEELPAEPPAQVEDEP